jgi:hypothetical protein
MHSVYGRLRSFYDRIRPYFGVLNDPVLRSYFSVSVYGEIRSYTGEYVAKRESHMGSVNERFFSVYRRISPYTVVYERACLTWVVSLFG